MQFVFMILAAIGAATVIFLLSSFVIGRTTDKQKLGEIWVRKNLKAAGIEETSVNPEFISKIARSAHLNAIASGPDYGRYTATTFKSDLDHKSQILIRHLLGGDISDDEKFLIGLIDDLHV